MLTSGIMLNQRFFSNTNWIKYLDRSTGLGSDYSMKILYWIRIAKISDLFNTRVHQRCADSVFFDSASDTVW